MVDGKELGAYENIYNCQLSADGHVAYAACKLTHVGAQSQTINDQCVGLDAQVWDLPSNHRFPGSSDGTAQPVFLSPDGQHVAWLEQTPGNNELCVSVNGKRGLGYKNIFNIVFSLDSQHINYVADQTSNGTYVVRDDDEAGPYKRAPNAGGTQFQLYLSSNGKHLAYQAGDGQMTFVVEDGKPQASYEAIYGPLVFSPDGEHLAYIAKAKDPTANLTPLQRQQAQQSPGFDQGLYIVLDGQQQPVLPSVRFGSAVNSAGPHFTPDGKHLAYTDDGKQIVADGRLVKQAQKSQQAPNGMDATFHFTADGKHVFWRGGNHYLIDGDEVGGYTATSLVTGTYHPILESDGSVFFFGTKDGDIAPRAVGQGPGAIAISPALYRVTVNPGPARDFGTSAALGQRCG